MTHRALTTVLRLQPLFGLALLPGNHIDLWHKFKPRANGGEIRCVLLGIKRAEEDSGYA
jgi:hypothetical protein